MRRVAWWQESLAEFTIRVAVAVLAIRFARRLGRGRVPRAGA